MKALKQVLLILCPVFLLFNTIWIAAGMAYNGENSIMEFDLSCQVNYDDAILDIYLKTPAEYGQKISVVLYRPHLAIGSPAEIENVDNPAASVPLNDLSQIFRIKNIVADYSGKAECTLNFSDNTESGFYILSVSGGGFLAPNSYASRLIYYETPRQTQDITIPSFNAVTESSLESLLQEKSMLFGIDLGQDYQDNKSEFNKLFISVRGMDFGNQFTKIDDIRNAISFVNILRTLYRAESAEEIAGICKENAVLIGIDLTDSVYISNKDKVFEILQGIVKKEKPLSMKTLGKGFRQGVALAALNNANATTASDILLKYAVDLEFDAKEYRGYCEKYGETEVNKAFIGRDFKYHSDVLQAYADVLSFLTEKNEGKNNNNPPTSGSKDSGRSYAINDGVTQAEKESEKICFTDVGNDYWGYTPICALSKLGIINGYDDGSFKPEENVTREEFVKMLVSAFDFYDEGAIADFVDVPSNVWSYSYIASAKSIGLVNGNDNRQFNPHRNITREDMAVMIYRLCKSQEITLNAQRNSDITDIDNASDYAQNSINLLFAAGIVNGMGDGTFAPQAFVKRSDAASIIYNTLKTFKKVI